MTAWLLFGFQANPAAGKSSPLPGRQGAGAPAATDRSLGSQAAPSTPGVWFVDGSQPNSLLGYSAASAGDVNGDGYADVIIGEYGSNPERVLVYEGSADGLHTTPDWTVTAEQPGSLFGVAVAPAGDVDGDGYSDVLVGAAAYEVNQHTFGRVYLYRGSAAGLGTAPAWTLTGPQQSDEFGNVFGTAGDVNGDGYADVLVSAPEYHNAGGDLAGRVWLYLGSTSGLALTSAWSMEGDALSNLGMSVATAGDIDADGYDDVVVGGYIYQSGDRYGRVSVAMGSPSGLSSFATILQGSQPDSKFGKAVGTAGDVNGDGYADVIVGAPDYNVCGRAYLYLGSTTGLRTTASWIATSEQSNSDFGYSVGSAGDVNGDGYSDIIVGAHSYYLEYTPGPHGRAFVYLGGPGGPPVGPSWMGVSDQTQTDYGFPVGTAGDVDHDGYSDVIVGALYYNQGRGRAYVYGGSAVGLGTSPGAGDAGSEGAPLTLKRLGIISLKLTWGSSCAPADVDYSIYMGTMGAWASHTPLVCSTSGDTSYTLRMPAGNRYYLVVPNNEVHEGSYGRDSGGNERPQGPTICRAQQIAPCP